MFSISVRATLDIRSFRIIIRRKAVEKSDKNREQAMKAEWLLILPKTPTETRDWNSLNSKTDTTRNRSRKSESFSKQLRKTDDNLL